MPTIRNGRDELTVYDMGPPPGNPSGPVERLQPPVEGVTPAALSGRERDPELMAESRSRGGKAKAEIVARRRDEASAQERRVATMNASLSPRQAEVVEALRRLGSRRAVLAELGMGVIQEVDVSLIRAHEKGLLPLDLPDLPPRLQRAIGTLAVPAVADAPPAAEPERPATPIVGGLPCVSCSHAAVCVIRPELEAWHATIERPVSPLAAITVLEARVELACEYFLATVS